MTKPPTYQTNQQVNTAGAGTTQVKALDASAWSTVIAGWSAVIAGLTTVSRGKLIAILIVPLVAVLILINHPICDRCVGMIEKLVDHAGYLHIKNNQFEMEYKAKEQSAPIAGNRDP